jgi:hypothetical protein
LHSHIKATPYWTHNSRYVQHSNNQWLKILLYVVNTGTNKFGIDIYAIKVDVEGKVMFLNNKGAQKIKLINFLTIFTFSCISNYTIIQCEILGPSSFVAHFKSLRVKMDFLL